MNSPWKVVLMLVGIFLAGAFTGGIAVRQWGRELLAKRSGPEQWEPIHIKRLSERLKLTEEQLAQIRPLVRRNMTEMAHARETWQGESKAIMERMQREISALLTPDQRAIHEQMNKEQREKAKKLMQERTNRQAGPGGGKPPGPVPPPPARP
jgi:Spy/CpxP family protein refolding chaperone